MNNPTNILIPKHLGKLIIVITVILIVGALVFGYGVISAGQSMELVVTGKRVQGIATSAERANVPGVEESFFSVVEFKDDSGQLRKLKTNTAQGGAPQYPPGTRVTALYLSKNPERAKINDNGNLWLAPIMCLIFSNLALMLGCFLGIVGYIELLTKRKDVVEPSKRA